MWGLNPCSSRKSSGFWVPSRTAPRMGFVARWWPSFSYLLMWAFSFWGRSRTTSFWSFLPPEALVQMLLWVRCVCGRLWVQGTHASPSGTKTPQELSKSHVVSFPCSILNLFLNLLKPLNLLNLIKLLNLLVILNLLHWQQTVIYMIDVDLQNVLRLSCVLQHTHKFCFSIPCVLAKLMCFSVEWV